MSFHLFPKVLVHLHLSADAQAEKKAEGDLHCLRTQPGSATHHLYARAIGEGRSRGRKCTQTREVRVRNLGGQAALFLHSLHTMEGVYIFEGKLVISATMSDFSSLASKLFAGCLWKEIKSINPTWW